MKDLTKLKKHRISGGNDPHNGAFKIKFFGREYLVIATDGLGWEHVSISSPHVTPSWDVMCKLKEMFFEDDEVVIQYHPKKSEYVTNHKHCLHLWRPIEEGVEIPTPPSMLVGIKELGQLN